MASRLDELADKARSTYKRVCVLSDELDEAISAAKAALEEYSDYCSE